MPGNRNGADQQTGGSRGEPPADYSQTATTAGAGIERHQEHPGGPDGHPSHADDAADSSRPGPAAPQASEADTGPATADEHTRSNAGGDHTDAGAGAGAQQGGHDLSPPGGDTRSRDRIVLVDGHPVTVVEADRTLGDTSPAGIGSKPTGGELLNTEDDDAQENRADKLLRKMFEHADDVHDQAGEVAETIHSFRHPDAGPASQPAAYHGVAVSERPPSEGMSVNDAVGSIAIVAVAAAAGIRRLMTHRPEGRETRDNPRH
jgi:hypothetical protein